MRLAQLALREPQPASGLIKMPPRNAAPLQFGFGDGCVEQRRGRAQVTLLEPQQAEIAVRARQVGQAVEFSNAVGFEQGFFRLRQLFAGEELVSQVGPSVGEQFRLVKPAGFENGFREQFLRLFPSSALGLEIS